MTSNKNSSNTESSSKPKSADTIEQFLAQEFQQSWGYQQHIESQMVNHLRFYVTLLLGLASVAIAISRFGDNANFPSVGFIGLLFFGFWFVGQILRTVYLELRIRKMLALEDLNSIREYFDTKSPIISEYSAFPTRRNESPPFLRKGSAEWYSIIFMALTNSLSLLVVILLTNHQWRWALFIVEQLHLSSLVLCFAPLFLILIVGGFFCIEFRLATLHCYKYDLKRRCEIGPSQYGLLELKDRSIMERILIGLGQYFERRYDKKLDAQKGKKQHREKE